uniref:Uncharacterized protein n=1 Tax=Timema douglasi TaxID=61478 RepID=A0A7R8ZC49_TIMDO|nr:unnamed protein product [Timema douglasi]
MKISRGGGLCLTKYSSPMASLVLTDSSQLTSDSQHLVLPTRNFSYTSTSRYVNLILGPDETPKGKRLVNAGSARIGRDVFHEVGVWVWGKWFPLSKAMMRVILRFFRKVRASLPGEIWMTSEAAILQPPSPSPEPICPNLTPLPLFLTCEFSYYPFSAPHELFSQQAVYHSLVVECNNALDGHHRLCLKCDEAWDDPK